MIASRGYVQGAAARYEIDELIVSEAGSGIEAEKAALDGALVAVRTGLDQRARTAPAALGEILDAHLELLDDPMLLEKARTAIRTGKSAGFAWRAGIEAVIQWLNETGDARLMERAGDFYDLERQVLHRLNGSREQQKTLAEGSILVARELTPSQLIDLDAARLAGIALMAGGPTSHVAILAANLGIPMLVSLGPELQSIPDGARLILDAEAGELNAIPTEAEFGAAGARIAQGRERRARELDAAKQDCHLASGERIELFANLAGNVADTRQAVEQGAEGCGLLRTEFLFLERATAPDQAEQLRSYQQVADLLARGRW